jgi:hypothetical protein
MSIGFQHDGTGGYTLRLVCDYCNGEIKRGGEFAVPAHVEYDGLGQPDPASSRPGAGTVFVFHNRCWRGKRKYSYPLRRLTVVVPRRYRIRFIPEET